MRLNQTKRRLAEGGHVLGCFLRYADPGLAELIALQGFDFLVLDAEHGTADVARCEELVRACELRDASPLIRVPANERATILRYLDTGAAGLHIPLVSSVAEAEAAVAAMKYAPRGARGLAGVRAAEYGQTGSLSEYIRVANEETLVVIQIETREAVAEAGAIAAIDAVDVLFIGPTDLSLALGVLGEPTHPDLERAYAAVAVATADAGKTLGVLATDEDNVRVWRERGARYIAVTSDGLLTRSAKAFLVNARWAAER